MNCNVCSNGFQMKCYQANDAKQVFNSQMNYIASIKNCELKSKYIYGNQALSMQDPYNLITYRLYKQP